MLKQTVNRALWAALLTGGLLCSPTPTRAMDTGFSGKEKLVAGACALGTLYFGYSTYKDYSKYKASQVIDKIIEKVEYPNLESNDNYNPNLFDYTSFDYKQRALKFSNTNSAPWAWVNTLAMSDELLNYSIEIHNYQYPYNNDPALEAITIKCEGFKFRVIHNLNDNTFAIEPQ